MKQHLFFFCLLLSSSWLSAQNGKSYPATFGNSPVTVTYERSDKGEVIFWGENMSYSPYTVTLTFSNLVNTASISNGEPKDVVVQSGKERLLSLRPTDAAQSVGFSYRVNIRKGDFNANPDTNFVYLFPLVEDKAVRVSPMTSLEKVLGKPDKPFFTGFSFKTEDGDTITAVRSGTVAEVEEQSASTGENKTFSATENYVEVCHKDGTIARYKLFRNEGVFVAPGDRVVAGQPLGIIAGSNYKGGSHLRLSISSPRLKYRALTPPFYLGGGKVGNPVREELYVSEHPQKIVMQEMSKKEKKKYIEN